MQDTNYYPPLNCNSVQEQISCCSLPCVTSPTCDGYPGWGPPLSVPHVNMAPPPLPPSMPPPSTPPSYNIETWGAPVWKKKWLLGKWKYQGVKDTVRVARYT